MNGPEVILPSSYKAKLFAMNFASDSTLDDKSRPVSNFPLLTGHKLCNISTTVREVSRLTKNLDPKKVTSPDTIQVVVLKNINPELSPILA